MQRIYSLFYFFLFLLLLSGCRVYTVCNSIEKSHNQVEFYGEEGVPRLEIIDEIPIVHLYGSNTEMGQQYGELLKNQLNAIFEIVDIVITEKVVNKYIAQAQKSFSIVPEEIIQFINGVAEASGIPAEDILALNLVPRIGCSVLAVWGNATADGNLLMGRNADYSFKRVNKALGLLVVKHPNDGLATISSSFIGIVGSFTGMNEKGVSYGNMLSYNGLNDELNEDALPIQLLLQLGGEKYSTAREMSDYLTGMEHMIPINVMCADTIEAIITELAQYNSAVREGTKGVLAASNYFYSSGMFAFPENDGRFADLMLMSKEYYGEFNLEILQKAMYKARQKNKNLQCILFEPSRMKMHVSMNKVPASKGPFVEFDVGELFLK